MRELKDSQQKLQAVIQAMAQGSEKVAAAGDTMSMSAQTLAMRTDEQGASLQETIGGVRQVVGQVQSAAAHTASVDQRCDSLHHQTRAGVEVVDRTVGAISLIEKRAQDMGEAITLIEGIAFQTNILALNAAVEAARAGASGKGFAVVASEVRSLALRSTQAAGEVRQLISRVNEQAGAGVKEVHGVKAVLEKISGGVAEVTQNIRSVADDAQQQSQALEQIMSKLETLSQLTESNAVMVGESVMAADEMRDDAQKLREVVSSIGVTTAALTSNDSPIEAKTKVEFF